MRESVSCGVCSCSALRKTKGKRLSLQQRCHQKYHFKILVDLLTAKENRNTRRKTYSIHRWRHTSPSPQSAAGRASRPQDIVWHIALWTSSPSHRTHYRLTSWSTPTSYTSMALSASKRKKENKQQQMLLEEHHDINSLHVLLLENVLHLYSSHFNLQVQVLCCCSSFQPVHK